jgi:cobalt-zinc-cadmium efflux system outer membrane protein
MKRLIAACATAWLPWAAAQPHHGWDDPPHEPHVVPALTRAFEAAWKISVESVQAEGLMLRAQAERDVADSLLAGTPAVELEHREARPPGGGSARESEAALVMPVWMPGQKKARGAAADAEAAFAEATLHAARLRVAGEVREAAWQLIAVEAEEAAARIHLEGLRELATDVDRRVAAGDLARADAMAATGEMLAARAAHQDAATRVDAARARWSLLTSLPTILDANEHEREPAGEHPARALARGATERAQRHLDYVKASRREPP